MTLSIRQRIALRFIRPWLERTTREVKTRMESKPALASKINRLQLVGGGLQGLDMLITWLTKQEGFLPPEWHAGLAVAQSIVTIVLRTWFSGTPIKGLISSGAASE